jgi:hypothetical protein
MYAEMFGHLFQTHSMLSLSLIHYVYCWQTSYRFLGLVVNRFAEQHRLFRIPAIGSSPGNLASGLEKWNRFREPPKPAVKVAESTVP